MLRWRRLTKRSQVAENERRILELPENVKAACANILRSRQSERGCQPLKLFVTPDHESNSDQKKMAEFLKPYLPKYQTKTSETKIIDCSSMPPRKLNTLGERLVRGGHTVIMLISGEGKINGGNNDFILVNIGDNCWLVEADSSEFKSQEDFDHFIGSLTHCSLCDEFAGESGLKGCEQCFGKYCKTCYVRWGMRCIGDLHKPYSCPHCRHTSEDAHAQFRRARLLLN